MKMKEREHVEEDLKSNKNVFLKLDSWYKYDHFIIFI